jgi:hypothetical protein
MTCWSRFWVRRASWSRGRARFDPTGDGTGNRFADSTIRLFESEPSRMIAAGASCGGGGDIGAPYQPDPLFLMGMSRPKCRAATDLTDHVAGSIDPECEALGVGVGAAEIGHDSVLPDKRVTNQIRSLGVTHHLPR